MSRWIIISSLLALPIAVTGCKQAEAERPQAPAAQTAAKQQAESVEVTAGEHKAEVKAGGAEVKVDEERGEVSVKAPGTSIEVREGGKHGKGRVKINVGGVKIDVPEVDLD